MSLIAKVLLALGIGRPAETSRRNANTRPVFCSLCLKRWSTRMRFGWIVSWDGPYRHRALGIAGPDWDGGNWLGGRVWRKHGPFVTTYSGRRGSLRGDRRFARIMKCPCPREGLLWPIGYTHHDNCPISN